MATKWAKTGRTALFGGVLSASLVACQDKRAETYTLYRNSPYVPGVRVHWATFDAAERDPSYNRNNCEMAARVLNANSAAHTRARGKEPDPTVGFWCEAGRYTDKGASPAHFEAAFPTDVY
jgi:hypothetical protein